MSHRLPGIGDVENSNSEVIERRKERRYKVKDGIFTVPKPKIQSSRLGNVIDVSMGGLSFHYFLVKNMSFQDFEVLDIYISGDGMFLDDLPIRIASAIELHTGEKQVMTIPKRFGVEFVELDPTEKTKLHFFIEHHTLCAI